MIPFNTIVLFGIAFFLLVVLGFLLLAAPARPALAVMRPPAARLVNEGPPR